MRKICITLLLLPFTVLNAAPPAKFDWNSHQKIIGFSAGRYYVDFTHMNNQLHAWDFHKTFSPIDAVGLSLASPVKVGKSANDAAFALEFFLPQEIASGTSDSLKLKLHGWHLETSIFGKDLIPGEMAALVVAPGVDWGTMKMKRTVTGGETHYKNPFVAPMARADLRFVFGPVAVGARVSYRYDITYDKWKRRNDDMPKLPGTKFSGLGAQVFVGLAFEASAD